MRGWIVAVVMTILGINTIAAQCPDYVATNAAETCVGVAWLGSDVPEPLPPGFTIVEAPYIYLTGGGTSIADLALYTLNGEITNPLDCGLSINLFTGTLFFQDYSCTYVNGVLPVTLTSFEVHQKHNSVVVEWSTSYEYQNKEFNVQRSKDGLNWEIIGTVVGAGSTDANMEYRFVDEFPRDGENYYRLKQVDFDGESELSDIHVVKFSTTEIAYPNPVSDVLTIRGKFDLFTINGQLIVSGLNENVDVSDLPAGIYIVRQGSNVQKVFKK